MNTPNLHDRCFNAVPFNETLFSRAGHPNDDLLMGQDECNHSEGHATKYAIFRTAKDVLKCGNNWEIACDD